MNKTLFTAALRYRATALFKTLDDSQIFAVKLDDGETGYCCVMGNGGTHYALGFYRGRLGFNTYLCSIGAASSAANQMELFELQNHFHVINCDFENAADSTLPKKTRDEIRKIAAEDGLKICRPKGWPEFIVFDGTRHTTLLTEQQQRDMTLALEAGCEVARRIEDLGWTMRFRLGFVDDYPPMEGGKRIPLLTRGKDGGWKWSVTETPAYWVDEEQEDAVPEFDNEEAVKKIRGIRRMGIIESRIVHFPSPVGSREDNYFPVCLLTVSKPNGTIPLMPMMEKDDEDVEFKLLDNLADNIISTGFCPMTIETDDRRTYTCLEDFCDKTGIRLRMVKSLQLVPEVWEMLQNLTF